jgi:formylglycine-generating enzyme required for sulfatase activity
MPSAQDLPDDLKRLASRNAIKLSDVSWNREVDQLINVLERFITIQQSKKSKLAIIIASAALIVLIGIALYVHSTRGLVTKTHVSIELVSIPPGSFRMGSEKGHADEKPVHKVTIGKGFYMGKYEVTQAQWQALMGEPHDSYSKGDNLPVDQVSWNEAQKFIDKLNTQNDGYTYRLPTEAEWEYTGCD